MTRYLHLWLVIVSVVYISIVAAEEDEAKNRLQKGCLYNKLDSHNQLRVCNSEDYLEDGIDPVVKGVCRAPDFDYLEVRIKCQVSGCGGAQVENARKLLQILAFRLVTGLGIGNFWQLGASNFVERNPRRPDNTGNGNARCGHAILR